MLAALQRRFKQRALLPSETLEGAAALDRLRSEGLLLLGTGNPVDHIGTAFEYAAHYGIVLQRGLTFASVRASLPHHLWKAEPKVHYIPDGSWVDRGTVQEAVVSCLLSCRSIGVL